jgi:AraC-like DNA-binding protein
VRTDTVQSRRRLYLLSRAIVARHYSRRLTLAALARALSSSPRQLQRAYAQFGRETFREDLQARRLAAAAILLAEQPSIPVRDVARLVGYRQPPHFARAFRRHYGLAPARFRARARQARERARTADAVASPTASGSAGGSIPGRESRISMPPSGAPSAPTAPTQPR